MARSSDAVSRIAQDARGYSSGQKPSTAASFDLYSEPWIPVVRAGNESLVSLRTAIAEAHEIDGLSTLDGPRFAGLLRMLLALVMDVYGQTANDREWVSRREQGRFELAVLDAYVDAVGRSRFDLFDDEYPFMQSASTPFTGKSIAELLPHVAVGNRTPLFTPDTDTRPRPLTFPEAAQALVALQAVAVPQPGRATSEDAGESWSGVDFGGRVGVIGFSCPIGDTLFETVMLNSPNGPHQARDEIDLPAWRRSVAHPSRYKRHSDGIADLLTWTPRRVRLIPDGDVVLRLGFLGGDALLELDLSHEPHTPWISDGTNSTWGPRGHRPHTLGWRGLPQLLALRDPPGMSQPSAVIRDLSNRIDVLPPNYRVTILSLYIQYGGGKQRSVFDDIITDIFPLPIRAFGEVEVDIRDMLVDVVSTAEGVRELVSKCAADIYSVTHRDLEKPNPKAKSFKDKRGRKASWAYAAKVEAELLAQIDALSRRFLSDLAGNPDSMDVLRARWAAEMRSVVDSTIAMIKSDCGPSAFALLAKENKRGEPSVWVRPPALCLREFRRELSQLVDFDAEGIPV